MATLPSDTLTANAELLQQLKQNGQYDYERELMATDDNLFERFMNAIGDSFRQLLQDLFGTTNDSNNNVFWWIAFALAISLIAWVMLRNRSWVFSRRSGSGLDFDELPDNIYAIDLDGELASALSRTDWPAACRWRFLKLLRLLADGAQIAWQPFKTVSQYAREWPNADFHEATNSFLRVRYGHFNATEQTYRQIDTHCTACEQIIETHDTGNNAEEGGEQL